MSLEKRILSVVSNFETLSLESLSTLMNQPVDEVEACLSKLILSGKLEGFKIDNDFLVNTTEGPNMTRIALQNLQNISQSAG